MIAAMGLLSGPLYGNRAKVASLALPLFPVTLFLGSAGYEFGLAMIGGQLGIATLCGPRPCPPTLGETLSKTPKRLLRSKLLLGDDETRGVRNFSQNQKKANKQA